MSTVYHFSQVIYGDGSWADKETVRVRDYIGRFATLVGKTIYGYSNWLSVFPSVGADSSFIWMLGSGDHGLLPLFQNGTLKALAVGWTPVANYDYNDQQTMKNIIAGAYDAYIAARAQECKTFGYPIYMRFGAEMNVNQGAPEPTSWAKYPADFVGAWRRIVDIFRAQNVTNVQWVWNPNFAESPGAPNHWTAYYPGDGYVDWVGIDMYQHADNVDPDTQMAGLYNDYGSRKPIGIFEWGVNSFEWSGVNTPDAVRASYMEKFFNAVEARPNIKLICYFYYGPFKFDSSTPLTLAKYQQRIANPMYIGIEPPAPTSPLRKVLPVLAPILIGGVSLSIQRRG